MPGNERDTWVEAVARNWREASLGAREQALCQFAEALTFDPASMREHHLARLRAQGLSEFECFHAIQVVSYFNFINRVADAAHVDLEPEMPPYPLDDSESPRPTAQA